MGKTVGLIGYGFNGSATAQRLSGFGCNVLAYDKYLVNYGNAYAWEVTLEELMEKAEVISLHVPLTEETRHLVNDDFIKRMAHPFFLLNMARGEIVGLESVVNGLKSGKIRGTCLDVLENEKLSMLTPNQQAAFDYLRTSDRVILTPHVAGWTQESYVKINEVLVKQILASQKVEKSAI
jgi:D-3-phosphoglycerate dehydrogenase / 2-oxoglutarate reductase